MAMQHGGDIHYGIKFNVDKSNLNAMKTSLQEIRTLAQNSLNNIGTQGTQQVNTQLQNILTTTQKIDVALDSAFDMSLGNVNLAKFNQNLQASGVNLKTYQQQLASIGPAGQASFRNLATEIMTTTMKIQQSNTMLDKMKTTFANTIRWSISSSILMGFTSSVQKAYSYVKELDTSLNNIMLVTEKSADQMAAFARQANKAAKELGQTTTAYTNASLIYYQQGLADAEVSARTETTLKAANVTKQSADAVSEQLTAVWNGYKVTAAETELYIDKLAKVAATTAADLEELSTGMSKVASAANIMGVDIDQLNGMLSTVISVTREAPESIGTSFKTIFARMSDIEAGLDTETTLGEYTQGMADLGFNVLDAQGKIRDMGEVVEEIGGKWNTLTREQQLSLAQTMAGTRQYSRLLSLFDNWDMYTKAVNESANATGFLQQQQDEYMESMEAHLAQLKAASQGLYDSLINGDSLKDVINIFTGIITFFDNGVQAIGGGGTVLLMSLLGLLNMFSDKLAITLGNASMKMAEMNINTANEVAQMELLNQFEEINDSVLQDMVLLKRQMLTHSKLLTQEETDFGNNLLKNMNYEAEKLDLLKQQEQTLSRIAKERYGYTGSLDFNSGDVWNNNPSLRKAFYAQEDNAKSMTKGISSYEVRDFSKEMDPLTQDRKELLNNKGGITKRLMNQGMSKEQAHSSDEYQKHLLKINELETQMGQKSKDFIETQSQAVKNFYGENSTQYKQVKKELEAYTDSMMKHGSAAQGTKDKLAIVSKTLQNFGKDALQASADFKKGMKTDFTAATKSAELALNDLVKAGQKMSLALDTRALNQNLLRMVSSVGMLAMSFQQLIGITKIWENESLSTGEKFLQTLQTAGFMLPMFISSFSSFVNLIKDTGTILTTDTTVRMANNEAKRLGIQLNRQANAEENFNNLTKALSTKLEDEEVRTILKKNGVQIAENAGITEENRLRAAQLILQGKGITVDTLEAGMNKKVTATIWAKVKAQMAANWWILAVIGSVLALAGGLALADKAWNKDKIAAEKASSAAAQASQTFADTQSAYNSFKENVSKYSDITAELNQLTEGTIEYKEKVIEANQAAMQLINTLGLLATDYSINSKTGLIEIEPGIWEDIQEQQLAILEKAQSYNTFAQQRSAEASQRYEQTKFEREQLQGIDGGPGDFTDRDKKAAITQGAGAASGALAGAAVWGIATKTGASIGALGGPWGIAIGAAVGLIVAGVATGIQAFNKKEAVQEEENALNKLAEIAEQRVDGQITKQDIENLRGKGITDRLADSLLKNIDATNQQIKAINANTEALRRTYEQQVNSVLTGTDWYESLGKREQGLAGKLIGDAAAKAENKESESYKEAKKKAEKVFDRIDDDETYQEYLDRRFGEDAKNYRVTDMGGTNATLQRKNQEGTWENVGESDSLSNDEVIEFLTQQYLIEDLADDKNIQKNLEYLTNLEDKLDDIKGVDKEEILSIQESLAQNKIVDLSVMSPEQVKELKIQANNAGEDIGNEYLNSINKAIEVYQKDGYGETKYLTHLEQQYQNALNKTASALEIDKDVLELYTDALVDNYDELENNKKIAVDVAKQNISFAMGVENLQKALEDNLDVLREWNEDSLETYEAAAQVQSALEEMFGIKVSADFIHEKLGKIQKAAEGDISAIEELQVLAARDFVVGLEISDEYKTKLDDLITEIENKGANLEIGGELKLENSEGIAALNELLLAGAVTEEQMQDMFNSLGYSPNVDMVEAPEPQVTRTVNEVTRTDQDGNVTQYTDEIISSNYVQVPQIVPEGESAKTDKSGNVIISSNGGGRKTSSAGMRARAIGSLGDKNIKSGAQKNAEKMKYLDEERDIYHDINIELEKLENNLEKVQKAREKMVGGDVIDSLDEELGLLNKQISAQKTKLEIAKLESQALKEILSNQGVQFSEDDGTITNYNTILNAKESEINKLISAYKASNSEDEQEKIQEQIDKKQEAYDKFKENLERYDEVTFSELAELENEISESISQKIELNIEKFTKDINLKIDLNEFKKEWRELQQGILFGDDDNFATFQSAAEGLKDVFGADGEGLLTDQLERTQLFLQEYDKIVNGGTSDIFEDSAAAALEAAQEMHEMSMESAQQALEYINTIKDAVDAAFEQIMGLHDSILDTFDHTLAVIEHQIAVKELLFGNNANIDTETEKKFEAQLGKIDAARVRMEDAQKRAEDILTENKVTSADELPGDELYRWTEQQVEISEAYEIIFSSVEEALETINTLLKQDIQNNLDIIEKKLTDNVGWDRLSERWEKDQELADVYLSGINKEYELQKLLNKINQDLLDKQYDSINAQKKINDFKNDELAILMQKDKLTQAELDRANKLYELTLLQIALDEARNNKSSMKLTRDSQGNYVYQYTTDEDAVAKAEQDLADKQNEIYNQNVDNAIDAISNFNQAGQEMQDEFASLFESDKFQEYLGLKASGEDASELENWLKTRMSEILEDYDYLMNSYQSSAVQSIGYIFKDLGIEDVDLNNLTDEQKKILLDEGIRIRGLENDWDDLVSNIFNFDSEKSLAEQFKDFDLKSIESIVNQYVENVGKVTSAAGSQEGIPEYYDKLDLIQMDVKELRDIYRDEKTKVWNQYENMEGTLRNDILITKQKLEELVKSDGLLATNNKNITDILSGNVDSISAKISQAITAIGKVETAMGGFVADLNILKKQIDDNLDNVNNRLNGLEEDNNDNNENDFKPPIDFTKSGYSTTYNAKVGDRVQYGSNTGSKSWKVTRTGMVGGQIQLSNQLTGEIKTVKEAELSGKYNDETWEDVDSNSKLILFNLKNGGKNVGPYVIVAKTSTGKFIMKNTSTGENTWVTGNDKANYVTNSKVPLSHFDTGGYTGSWFNGSKDGRLALLHQKELVLNEKDTPKILDAVKLVREISAGSIIKDFEAQMRNTLSSLENQLIGTYANIEGMAAATKQSTDQMLEQAVHIDASFPGVRDAREIEEALNNLVNVASQYAYENNK